MAAPPPAKPIDDIPTREILAGLARLHSFVVVSNLEGEIRWISEELGAVCGGAPRHIGHHLRQVFASLPGARAQAKLAEQVSQVQSHLRSHEALHNIRLDLGERDGARTVDLSAFRIETAAGERLVVAILHLGAREPGFDPVLRDQRDSLEAILACSPGAILALDRFGFVSYVNEAVSSTLGIDAEVLLDRPIVLLQPGSAEFVQVMSSLRSEGDLDDRELEIVRPDGRRVWVAITTRQRIGPEDRDDGHVIFVRDVSEQVARRIELERKNAELESYVHSVSHDLRSPLVSMLGFTRLLRQDYDHVFDETARHFADRIEQAGRTMNALIEDLLELCQIGAANEQRRLVDPRSVLLQLQAELKLRLEDSDAELLIPEDPPLLLCDRTRLYQLFSNLVGNALQHMGPCDDPTIRVSVTTEPERHVITVADRGRGIPGEELERIFNVFHSTRRESGSQSTGIGLAIVRKIAEMHGGTAWAESGPGQGARFHVSLPRS